MLNSCVKDEGAVVVIRKPKPSNDTIAKNILAYHDVHTNRTVHYRLYGCARREVILCDEKGRRTLGVKTVAWLQKESHGWVCAEFRFGIGRSAVGQTRRQAVWNYLKLLHR